MQPEGSSAVSPDCIGTLRIFTNHFPEAKVVKFVKVYSSFLFSYTTKNLSLITAVYGLQITSFLVLEESPPILLIAIGLDNGCIYCIKGDIARERITRFKLEVENSSDKTQSSITGLGFRVDGQALQLFAVTPGSVSLFSLQSQPPKRQTLDQIGSVVNSVAMSDRLVCFSFGYLSLILL